MTREDIVRMAKEVWGYSELMTNDLANAYDMGVANEREACAKVCDDLWKDTYTAYACAEAIRARSNT